MTLESRRHNRDMQRILRAGYDARLRGEGRGSVPYGMSPGELERRSWWLAGWNDADQELEQRETMV